MATAMAMVKATATALRSGSTDNFGGGI